MRIDLPRKWGRAKTTKCGRDLARQPESPHARRLRFARVRDSNIDRFATLSVRFTNHHGHYLGESDANSLDVWGKPAIPVYKTLGHIPMWSNRWNTMPIHSRPDITLPMPDDRVEDPEESRNDVDSAVASGAVEMLREAMVAVQAPSDHFERLGLA